MEILSNALEGLALKMGIQMNYLGRLTLKMGIQMNYLEDFVVLVVVVG
jgi:hypothetical protein